MAAKLINKGFTERSQLAVFLSMWGLGFLLGSLASLGVWSAMTGQGIMNMAQDMMDPRYAGAVKMVQVVSTLFVFFVPAFAYAFICYRNGWLALGVNGQPVLKITIISVLILLVCTPAIDALTQLNEHIPLPAKSKQLFDDIEKSYAEQVKVIGDVKSTGQYLLSLFMIAFLPAVFEETLFRGGLQNMLSRFRRPVPVYLFIVVALLVGVKMIWFPGKINSWYFFGVILVLILLVYRSQSLSTQINQWANHYLVPIIFTSILFSAIHGSWYGFIPRVALGMLLGLVFYYTQNIYYNILLHFLNNGVVVTFMFIAAKQKNAVQSVQEYSFPWWAALASALLLFVLFRWLWLTGRGEKPEEVMINGNNPFLQSLPEEEMNTKDEISEGVD